MKQTWKLHLNLNLHQNRNQEPQWNWNGHPNLNLTKSHEIVAILDQAVLVQDVCHANLVLCAGCVEMEWVTNHFYQVLLQVNSFRFGVSFRFSLCFRFSPSFSFCCFLSLYFCYSPRLLIIFGSSLISVVCCFSFTEARKHWTKWTQDNRKQQPKHNNTSNRNTGCGMQNTTNKTQKRKQTKTRKNKWKDRTATTVECWLLCYWNCGVVHWVRWSKGNLGILTHVSKIKDMPNVQNIVVDINGTFFTSKFFFGTSKPQFWTSKTYSRCPNMVFPYPKVYFDVQNMFRISKTFLGHPATILDVQNHFGRSNIFWAFKAFFGVRWSDRHLGLRTLPCTIRY